MACVFPPSTIRGKDLRRVRLQPLGFKTRVVNRPQDFFILSLTESHLLEIAAFSSSQNLISLSIKDLNLKKVSSILESSGDLVLRLLVLEETSNKTSSFCRVRVKCDLRGDVVCQVLYLNRVDRLNNLCSRQQTFYLNVVGSQLKFCAVWHSKTD